ncbi:MAG TPA: ComEA family DNA-binding protein [Gaiellaceae bacterium]|jgi:competence protein ComEA|nr:ComEA family DNA-binding protein [Gaiellaceae bacterium]
MPELPVSRGRALAIIACAAVALVVAGKLLVPAGAASDGGTPARPPTALRARSAPPLVVHVVGAVRTPGLYKLPRGSRDADAVAKAGGPTAKADLTLLNLAARLSDGQQVVVPERTPSVSAASGAGGAAPDAAGPVHLNSATVEQLDELPGVGPVTAQKIVDYRQSHGAFSSVDDLDEIAGIGPARLEQLRELVAP